MALRASCLFSARFAYRIAMPGEQWRRIAMISGTIFAEPASREVVDPGSFRIAVPLFAQSGIEPLDQVNLAERDLVSIVQLFAFSARR
jgi:hypothetical protein